MDILTQPDSLSLLGNIKAFEVATATPVAFKLYHGNTLLLDERYHPNPGGQVKIDVKDALSSHLAFHLPTTDIFTQSEIAATFRAEVDTASVTFTVVRAGVEHYSGTAANFLQGNFLTWQPQELPTRYSQPQWLTYYNATTADVKLKVKYYLKGGGSTIIEYSAINSGTCVTFNMQFSVMFSRPEVAQQDQQGYYDVWVENATGERLSYIQRYIYVAAGENEVCFLFENSLGGIDSVIFDGDHSDAPEMEFENVVYDDVSKAFNNKITNLYRQNTGHKTTRELVWLKDFFASSGCYRIYDGSIMPIVLSEGSVSLTSSDTLHSAEFAYKYASDKGFLNIPRLDALPDGLEIEAPAALFFLAPRLSEFPIAILDDNLLFPVQSPFEEVWRQLSWGAIKAYIASTVDAGVAPFVHLHANKAILDGLRENEFGQLTYKEEPIIGSGTEVGDHDHAGRLIRPGVLVIPKGLSPNQEKELQEGETALIGTADGNVLDLSILKYIKFEDGRIRFDVSIVSAGEVSAKGSGSGGSGSGIAYNRLDRWDDYTTGRAGDVLSAGLGYELHTRIKVFEEGDYAPAAHTHAIADITDFPQTWAWSKISGKPSSFIPSAHSHAISEITGLQTALDGKASNTHNHDALYAPLLHVGDSSHLTAEQRGVLACLSIIDGRLHSSVSFVSENEVSAKGSESGSGGGSGIPSYDRLDRWDNYNSTKAGFVLSAALGYDLYTRLSGKVDTIAGKGLSTNDYTTAEKTKLAGLSNYLHPSFTARTIVAGTGLVLSAITVNMQGHVTDVASKTLATGDIPALPISHIQNLQTTLDGKALSSHNHSTLYAPLAHVNDSSHLTIEQRNILACLSVVDGRLHSSVSFVSEGEVSNKGGGGSGGGTISPGAPNALLYEITTLNDYNNSSKKNNTFYACVEDGMIVQAFLGSFPFSLKGISTNKGFPYTFPMIFEQ